MAEVAAPAVKAAAAEAEADRVLTIAFFPDAPANLTQQVRWGAFFAAPPSTVPPLLQPFRLPGGIRSANAPVGFRISVTYVAGLYPSFG